MSNAPNGLWIPDPTIPNTQNLQSSRIQTTQNTIRQSMPTTAFRYSHPMLLSSLAPSQTFNTTITPQSTAVNNAYNALSAHPTLKAEFVRDRQQRALTRTQRKGEKGRAGSSRVHRVTSKESGESDNGESAYPTPTSLSVRSSSEVSEQASIVNASLLTMSNTENSRWQVATTDQSMPSQACDAHPSRRGIYGTPFAAEQGLQRGMDSSPSSSALRSNTVGPSVVLPLSQSAQVVPTVKPSITPSHPRKETRTRRDRNAQKADTTENTSKKKANPMITGKVNQSTFTETLLDLVERTQNDEQTVACRFNGCSTVITGSAERLSAHICKCHKVKPNFECQWFVEEDDGSHGPCGDTFAVRGPLLRHITDIHCKVWTIECPNCGDTFRGDAPTAERHKCVQRSCPNCLVVFASTPSYLKHAKMCIDLVDPDEPMEQSALPTPTTISVEDSVDAGPMSAQAFADHSACFPTIDLIPMLDSDFASSPPYIWALNNARFQTEVPSNAFRRGKSGQEFWCAPTFMTSCVLEAAIPGFDFDFVLLQWLDEQDFFASMLFGTEHLTFESIFGPHYSVWEAAELWF